ncbi:hypothetical protein MW887_006318 [Aspergillus wentii]|nr:hypothetical protein MW887_006318 [Aspergillus wentii]
MKHDINGDDNLLRGEVLAIIAAIESRMLFQRFDQHLTIPVMILSHGPPARQDHPGFHNGHNLIIRKGKLLELGDPDTNPFDVFVRFLETTQWEIPNAPQRSQEASSPSSPSLVVTPQMPVMGPRSASIDLEVSDFPS